MKKRNGKFWLVAIIAVTIMTVATSPAPAAETKNAATSIEKLDTAVNMIPADAAFYSSMLRGREQIEAIASSQAWKTFMEIPMVQMGLQLYSMQAASEGSVPGKIDKALHDPQVQELLTVLGDMCSEEVFIYGGSDVVDTVELLQKLNNVNRFSPLLQLDMDSDNDEQLQAKAKMILDLLAKNAQQIKIPNIIVGFKISDTQRVAAQLGKLDVIAGFALAQRDETADVFKKIEIGDASFSTFTLNGDMIPWHELPMDWLKDIETNPGDLDKVVDQIKKQKLVVSIGLRGNYLLIALGYSTEALANLGKGELLVSRPEVKRLDQFAYKRVTGIGYTSETFNRCIAGSQEDVDELLDVVDDVLPRVGLDEETQSRIRKDAAALADDIKPFLPQPGAVSGVSFLSDKGIEYYRFDCGKYPQMDGTKPLGILNHLGGSPLLAVVARSKVSPENYDLLTKWIRIAYGYAEQFALPQMEQEDREKFDKLAKAMMPMVKRLDAITRDKLLPAIADGQSGLVIDAKMKTKQIHEAVPATDEPMPMVEPAIVIGISDAKSFSAAVDAYWELLQDTAAALSDTLPDKPDIKLPEPKSQQTEVGEIYSLELPEEAGLDKQIGIYLGFNDAVAIICLNASQAQRMLAEKKLTAGGVLNNEKHPRAMAVVFNWPGTLRAALPWIEFALKKAASRYMSEDDLQMQLAMVQPQIKMLAKVLCCVQSITSESYFQDGVLVTHTLMEISDFESK